ncbi:MAG: CinA family protein [Rickettsiales bacterium]
MFSEELDAQAAGLLQALKSKGLKLATAESCTGGLISALFTEIPGSSAVFDRGFATYSNEAKTQMLGVDAGIIAKHGAVSEDVATAMAVGARDNAGVDLAVSVTGIAGPDGGTKEKPVGTVCIAVSSQNYTSVTTYHFSGDRKSIRLQTVAAALEMIEVSLSRSFSAFA